MLEAIAVLVVFGLIALLLGLSRWLARRHWAAAGNVAIALLLFFVAHRYWPAAAHLRTYEDMPAHAMIAQVYCERTGPRAYRVTLTRLPEGRMQVYEMTGDEWRLDARTLAWKGRAAQLGLRASYRLDRLSARYLTSAPTDGADPAVPAPPPASYALSDADEPGEDVWAQARTATRWEDSVVASHAYGPWRRLADGARYDVWMSRDPRQGPVRIDARPGNEAAAKAMLYTRPNDNVRTQG
ncbi:MAG TPA: hypothetical protein VF851_06590 [Steroidobacteraceae bacterium]